MLGGIIAAATSAIGSQIKGIEAREAEDRAFAKQKELMDKQYELNNSMEETVERIYNILVSEDSMSLYGSSDEIKKILMQNGLAITDESPIDFVIQYVPANTVNTDYLYTIYDQLLDQV